MKSTDSKPEAWLRSPRTTRGREISRDSAAVLDIAPIASWKRKMRAKSRDLVSFSVTAVLDELSSRSPWPESPRRRRALVHQAQK
jgi:hypothetical protein